MNKLYLLKKLIMEGTAVRKNQVSINLERFGDEVPMGYPKDKQVLYVYADSNNVYEALSKAYAEITNLIVEYEPYHSGRCDGYTNADGTSVGKMLGVRYKVSEYYSKQSMIWMIQFFILSMPKIL